MNFVYYYHDTASQEEFESVIRTIEKNYQIVSVEDMYRHIQGEIKLKNSCVFTIDDGWLSTYRYVFPAVVKLQIPITIFVSPKIILEEDNFWYFLFEYCNQEKVKERLIQDGIFDSSVREYPLKLQLKELRIDTIIKYITEDIGYERLKTIPRGFINKNELLEMADSGFVTVGAHTLEHPILKNESHDRSHYEILQSVNELSSLLNRRITTFAYPNGLSDVDFSSREMDFCREAGLLMAFSTNPGVIKSGETNPFSIPRCGSLSRIRLGRLGMLIPSLAKQERIREEIRKRLIV